jgi:hypothetical protein
MAVMPSDMVISISDEDRQLLRDFIEAVNKLIGDNDINIPSQWSADTKEPPNGVLTTAITGGKRLCWSNGKIYQEE